ncbi:Aste57867_25397 [Aphanomyces stellatus]|uniref:Aste57867_25397 protein n=1 Tax=Aphanomyces stellatus TaxID=120398 RepID=A0A485LSY6_9STRA|nr:hypothetical protein As57867_025318 [Aphanomyces stellatus]VFU02021.1 Aste57867_25397 [Aphanomyces stellatus]
MKTAILFTALSAASVIAAKQSVIALNDHERNILKQELDAWKTEFGQEAEARGLTPPTSNTESLTDTETDELQRFLDSKLGAELASLENPSAQFTHKNVFALLKSDEFARYVQVSFGNDTYAQAESVPERAEAVPAQVDWSSHKCNPPVPNQGQCGSCWAFSTLGATEFAHCLATDELLDLSEQQIVSCSTTSYGCQGGFPPKALDWIRGGVCTKQDWPYTAGVDGQTGSCNRSCQKQPLAIGQTLTTSGDAGLVAALASQPVTVVVEAGNDVWKYYQGGVITQCPGSHSDHAVVAIGYTSDSFKIKNSWGPNWGENGYIRLQRTTGANGMGMCNVVEAGSYSQLAVAPKPVPSSTPALTKPPTQAPVTKTPWTQAPLPTKASTLPPTQAPLPPTQAPGPAPGNAVNTYGQCGGKDYTGSKNCKPTDECHYFDEWYSQCLPKQA